jgi:ComF family protein
MGDGDGELICAGCKANAPHFRSGISCWLHTGTGRDIILALKYRNADFLKKDIGVLLKNNNPEICEFASDSSLVPVPIHYFRRVKRGYNQAEVIAQAIAKISSGSVVVNALKSKNKKSQTKLKSGERLLNVKNMFECSAESDGMAKSRRVVLVDDVSTTGATVRECCRVLYGAGFENLHVLTLARG